jgi:hypothetical protein
MSRRPTRHFEVVKTKLPPRPRYPNADGRFRSGPWRGNRDRAPDIELDEAVREEPETPARELKRSGPGVPGQSPALGRGECAHRDALADRGVPKLLPASHSQRRFPEDHERYGD